MKDIQDLDACINLGSKHFFQFSFSSSVQFDSLAPLSWISPHLILISLSSVFRIRFTGLTSWLWFETRDVDTRITRSFGFGEDVWFITVFINCIRCSTSISNLNGWLDEGLLVLLISNKGWQISKLTANTKEPLREKDGRFSGNAGKTRNKRHMTHELTHF